MDQRTVSNKKSEIKRPCLKDIFLSNLLAQNTQIAKVIWTGRKWNVSGVKEEKTFENYHCTFERKNFGIIALLFRGISTGGGQGALPPPPSLFPNNFSDFCFAKCKKTCSALHLCCYLICSGNKSWSIYELPPDCAILFSLWFWTEK